MGLENWDNVEERYTPEAIKRLAKKYDIDPIKTDLIGWLHSAGVNFLMYQTPIDVAGQRKLKKQRLAAIIRKSNDLLTLIAPIVEVEVYPFTEFVLSDVSAYGTN